MKKNQLLEIQLITYRCLVFFWQLKLYCCVPIKKLVLNEKQVLFRFQNHRVEQKYNQDQKKNIIKLRTYGCYASC